MTELPPEVLHLKIRYGFDNEVGDDGFFWPSSPTKRREAHTVRRNSPADFESTYQQNPGQREGSIFLEEDFSYYDAPQGLPLGIAARDVKHFCLSGHGIFQAWDTAFSASSDAAYTVGITGLFIPCQSYHCNEDATIIGTCETHFDVAILDVYRKKLQAGDLGGRGLVTAAREQFVKWQPELLLVENRASGITLIQSLPSLNIPVHGINPKEGKRARAINTINGAGSAQGWFKLHRVLFPRWADWLQALKTELKDFTGDESAVTDQVDAIVHLICYAIERGSQSTMLPSDWSPDRVEPMAAFDAFRDMQTAADDRLAFLMNIGELESLSSDPYEASCDRCSNFDKGLCLYHRRPVVALDLCEVFTAKVPGKDQYPMDGVELS